MMDEMMNSTDTVCEGTVEAVGVIKGISLSDIAKAKPLLAVVAVGCMAKVLVDIYQYGKFRYDCYKIDTSELCD